MGFYVSIFCSYLPKECNISGKGAVFSYDSLGMLSPSPYAASGPGEPLIMPFFDCQVNLLALMFAVLKKIGIIF